MTRKLASVQRIVEVKDIEGADRVSKPIVLTVGGLLNSKDGV